MTSFLKTPNGMPIYLVGKLTNDFSTIFCQALGDSIYFIGARDHLAVHIETFNRDNSLFYEKQTNWNITYAFDSLEVRRNIEWFKRKANSIRNVELNIAPIESQLRIFNNVVEAKLDSIIEKPPIPRIPEMDNGESIKLMNLKDMVNQVRSVKEGVLKLTLSNSGMKMSGSTHTSPVFSVQASHNLYDNGDNRERSTFCLKDMLLISCQLASEVGSQSANLKFYPSGATQVFSQGDNVSVRCLITAVKG
ncbi:MAG: hypothetical protein WA102_11565 [Candidatus Methanoperedens sp.]